VLCVIGRLSLLPLRALVLLPPGARLHITLEILCADSDGQYVLRHNQTPFPRPTWVPLIPLPRLIRRRS
jgi:hypothetical protein